MEPHREEQNKAPPAGAERKPKRFRIVKLEDRIAPSNGGTNGNKYTCAACSGGCIGTVGCTVAGCGNKSLAYCVY